jgi:vacuolar-type H+-ATPase subunit I/STV1
LIALASGMVLAFVVTRMSLSFDTDWHTAVIKSLVFILVYTGVLVLAEHRYFGEFLRNLKKFNVIPQSFTPIIERLSIGDKDA